MVLGAGLPPGLLTAGGGGGSPNVTCQFGGMPMSIVNVFAMYKSVLKLPNAACEFKNKTNLCRVFF